MVGKEKNKGNSDKLAFPICPRKARAFLETLLKFSSFLKRTTFFPIRLTARFVRSPVVYGLLQNVCCEVKQRP
jgi:hypothetical protein